MWWWILPYRLASNGIGLYRIFVSQSPFPSKELFLIIYFISYTIKNNYFCLSNKIFLSMCVFFLSISWFFSRKNDLFSVELYFFLVEKSILHKKYFYHSYLLKIFEKQYFLAKHSYGGYCLDYKILKKKSKPIPIDRSRRAEKEYVGLYTAKLVLSEKIQTENDHFPCMYSPLANYANIYIIFWN